MNEVVDPYFRKHRGRFATGLFNCLFKPGVLLRCSCQLVSGLLTYPCVLLMRNPVRRRRSAAGIKQSVLLLTKHSWRLLFRA